MSKPDSSQTYITKALVIGVSLLSVTQAAPIVRSTISCAPGFSQRPGCGEQCIPTNYARVWHPARKVKCHKAVILPPQPVELDCYNQILAAGVQFQQYTWNSETGACSYSTKDLSWNLESCDFREQKLVVTMLAGTCASTNFDRNPASAGVPCQDVYWSPFSTCNIAPFSPEEAAEMARRGRIDWGGLGAAMGTRYGTQAMADLLACGGDPATIDWIQAGQEAADIAWNEIQALLESGGDLSSIMSKRSISPSRKVKKGGAPDRSRFILNSGGSLPVKAGLRAPARRVAAKLPPKSGSKGLPKSGSKVPPKAAAKLPPKTAAKLPPKSGSKVPPKSAAKNLPKKVRTKVAAKSAIKAKKAPVKVAAKAVKKVKVSSKVNHA